MAKSKKSKLQGPASFSYKILDANHELVPGTTGHAGDMVVEMDGEERVVRKEAVQTVTEIIEYLLSRAGAVGGTEPVSEEAVSNEEVTSNDYGTVAPEEG